jgi:sarcosine oxidase delta subunit
LLELIKIKFSLQELQLFWEISEHSKQDSWHFEQFVFFKNEPEGQIHEKFCSMKGFEQTWQVVMFVHLRQGE